MSTTESDFMEVDPEMERIWREDDEPSFSEVRATMTNEEETEEVSEQPTDDEDSVEDETVSTEEVEEESEEDEPEATEEKAVEDNGTTKLKAAGMDLDLTKEELIELAKKGIDYTKKTQTLAPYRKRISAMEEAGLSDDDVNLMIDVLKGDKNAIATVLNRTKVDPLELDTDKVEYTPTSYGKDESTLMIEEIVSEISKDQEYNITAAIVDGQWDNKSRQLMAENPALIRGLHEEVKMGRYDIVAPIAMKMKMMDIARGSTNTASDLEYYQAAVDNYLRSTEVQSQQDKAVSRQQEIQDKALARKAAAPTKRMSGKKSVIDYLDDNDEEYDAWYRSTIAKS